MRFVGLSSSFFSISLFPSMIYFVLRYHFLRSTLILSLSLSLILLYSLCVFRLVSSARPSYIPGMPATYGPHSSRSAERPTAPHRWPCGDQPKAEHATALLLPKIISTDLPFSCACIGLDLIRPQQSKFRTEDPTRAFSDISFSFFFLCFMATEVSFSVFVFPQANSSCSIYVRANSTSTIVPVLKLGHLQKSVKK